MVNFIMDNKAGDMITSQRDRQPGIVIISTILPWQEQNPKPCIFQTFFLYLTTILGKTQDSEKQVKQTLITRIQSAKSRIQETSRISKPSFTNCQRVKEKKKKKGGESKIKKKLNKLNTMSRPHLYTILNKPTFLRHLGN